MNRKELLKEYRSRPQPMGLYQVRHRPTGRVYVGRAQNLAGMLNSVRLQLSVGTFGCRALQEDYRRDGETAFVIEALETLEPNPDPGVRPEDELVVLETMTKEGLRDRGVQGYNF